MYSVNWPPLRVSKLTFGAFFRANNEDLMLETSALKLLTVANLCYQLLLQFMLYSPTNAAPQFP